MFGWTYIDQNGEESGASHRFDDQRSAEDWMSQSSEGLAEFGISQVVLMDHQRGNRIYRMGIDSQ